MIKKHFTDPTYLRSIYDGLIAGIINKDNATALPIGLVGIYEEAFPPESNVNERKKFLEFFGLWTLLKKEVSVAFVLPLLEGWTEGEVVNYINRYSKWFNSPVSGKYILYHERFRAFLQQKISHISFTKINALIIKNAQDAIKAKRGDDWERYGLECLSIHLLIVAMETRNVKDLKALSYSTTHWNRQVEISKGFEWSKSMLNDMMLWASKYENEEAIECALNKVDLYHLEQNDAPRIVELVAQDDIETALYRIEAFGGNDKEGLQRKFILYMLCLMELTLLGSKDKSFRKVAIEKLLKHLDDNLPVDHSVLNWNDFFSSYLMFQIAIEIQKINIDFKPLFTRTNYWDGDWIETNGPFSRIAFNVLELMLKYQNNKIKTFENAELVIIECIKQNKINLVKELVFKLFKDELRDELLSLTAKKIAFNGNVNTALNFVNLIHDKSEKNICLIYFIEQLLEQKKLKEAKSIYNLITSRYYLVVACCIISNYLFDEKNTNYLSPLNGALNIYLDITNESWKLMAMRRIVAVYIYQRKFDKAKELLELSFQSNVNQVDIKDFYLFDISILYAKNKKVSLAIEVAEKIENLEEKNNLYNNLSIVLLKFKKLDVSNSLFKKIEIVKDSPVIYNWDFILSKYIKIVLNKGKIRTAIKYASQIKSLKIRSEAYLYISKEQLKKGIVKDYENNMKKALLSASNISDSFDKYKLMTDIYLNEIVNEGKINEAIDWVNKIKDVSFRDYAYCEISIELIKLKKIKESIVYANKITDITIKYKWLTKMVSVLTKKRDKKDTYDLLIYFLEYTRGINFENKQTIIHSRLEEMSFEFAKKGNIEKSIVYALKINSQDRSCQALEKISNEFFNQGKKDISYSVLEKALEGAREIDDEWDKIFALQAIANQFSKRENNTIALVVFKEAIETALSMNDEFMSNFFINTIAQDIAKLGMINEALECCHYNSDNIDKVQSIMDIYLETKKQGNIEGASLILNNVLVYTRKIEPSFKRSELLSIISAGSYDESNNEIAQSILEESIKYSNKIANSSVKNKTLKSIASAILKQGNVEKAYEYVNFIDDLSDINDVLLKISSHLVKNGEIDKAIFYAEKIDNEIDKSKSFLTISKELVNQKQIEQSINFASRINEVEDKDEAYSNIVLELAKLGSLNLVEDVGMKISKKINKQNCLTKIANNCYEQVGWNKALTGYKKFQSQEISNYYLKGIFDNLSILNCNSKTFLNAVSYCLNNYEFMEKLLQKYALHELFYNNAQPEKIQRFNRTLNINWAIDFKNQQPY